MIKPVGRIVLMSWVDLRMSFGIIDAIRMNKIIRPPTNTKNKLYPIQIEINIFLDIKAMNEHIIISIKIMELGFLQFIMFIAKITIIDIIMKVIAN